MANSTYEPSKKIINLQYIALILHYTTPRPNHKLLIKMLFEWGNTWALCVEQWQTNNVSCRVNDF